MSTIINDLAKLSLGLVRVEDMRSRVANAKVVKYAKNWGEGWFEI